MKRVETVNAVEIGMLTRSITETHEAELGCDECLAEVDRFVEMKLAGLDATEALPLVEDHLDKCGDCREEFEALMVAVQALNEEHSSGEDVVDVVPRLWRKIRGD